MRHIRCRFWPAAFRLLSVPRSFGKSKGRSEKGAFLALPHALLSHPDFRNLSGSALKVLIQLGSQYNGKNNGDLSASFTQAKKWGMNSRTTLAKALRELQERNLIVCTREGRFINPGGLCSLYAVTWKPIDECGGKLEVRATTTPPRKLTLEQANTESPQVS